MMEEIIVDEKRLAEIIGPGFKLPKIFQLV